MASKFYLMNEKAVRYGLNSPEEGVFTEPKGFGVKYNAAYLKVGDLWLADSNELAQPAPSGKIVFTYKPYETFQKFMGFVNTARSLVLVYQPAGLETEYFADIDIINIDKGGYNIKSRLEVPVKFSCKSLFYTEEEFEYHIERADKEMRWDFKWETRFNDLSNIYFTFENDGHVDAPFQLSFTGYCTNPTMTIVQEGKEVCSVTFGLTLQSNERLTFSTFDDDLFIEVDGVDRKDCLDFTKENFFKVPMGVSEIFFKASAGNMNNIALSLEKYYKGV